MILELKLSIPAEQFEEAQFQVGRLLSISNKPEYGIIKYHFYGYSGREPIIKELNNPPTKHEGAPSQAAKPKQGDVSIESICATAYPTCQPPQPPTSANPAGYPTDQANESIPPVTRNQKRVDYRYLTTGVGKRSSARNASHD